MKGVAAATGLVILGFGFVVPAHQQAQKKPDQKWVSYSQNVATVFKASCYSCHTGKDAAADLDLSNTEELLSSGIIKVGDPENSTLIRRMKGLDGLPAMPKGFKPISDDKIQAIADWIKAGAKIDKATTKHWAYVAPVKPLVPKDASGWSRNEIDNFVLEQQIAQKLKHGPEASKEALARRLYLDLIGLPPTVEQLDEYLRDASPKAYENLVDKLLASSHYGERQARMWLDIARYADTNGYEKDAGRTAWAYRDWVIDAFNSNMPYSEFTIEQLAGDMMPDSTVAQKVATGFVRNSMFNEEGGVDPGESFYTAVIDRVSTASTTWLGSTLQCARCHDHKFDPFSQKDFYKLYAVFSNVDYRKDGDYKVSDYEHWIEPTIKVISPEIQKAYDEAKQQVTDLQQKKKQLVAENPGDFIAWHSVASQPVSFVTPKVELFKSTGGATSTITDDGIIEVGGPNPNQDEYQITFDMPKGRFTGVRIEALPEGAKPPGRSDGKNFLLTDVRLTSDEKEVELLQAKADFVQEGYDADKVVKGDPQSGWAIYPRYDKPAKLIVQFKKPLTGTKAVLKLGFRSRFNNHNLGRFRVSFTEASYPLLDVVSNLKIDDSKSMQEAYLATSTVGMQYKADLDAASRKVTAIEAKIPTALVLQEKPIKGKLIAAVHHRGEYLSPGEMVEAGTPDLFPKADGKADMNRLEFGKWLVNGKNPLVARVQVNRMWEQYFGRGIVETLDDFGTQGAAPSNQKLLDWLSVKFVESNWDMKAIHKLIVMSATYRQSSNATKEALEKDPENIFLARGPRFRMEAEMIRDTALQASNLLNPKIGGPSVMPYQPNGVWDSPYNGAQWMENKDQDRFRRGIYVFSKRTAMYPSFMSFDASTRETCLVRRIRTNTPLQALTLLNDIAYLEAAKALGAKMQQRGTLEQGLVYGFRAATSRKPSREELVVLAKSYETFKNKYAKNPAEAKKLGKDEREAAWTMIGNILLNLDETITKG